MLLITDLKAKCENVYIGHHSYNVRMVSNILSIVT